MSGHKQATISLSLEEYHRLLDADVQQRAQVDHLPSPPPEVIQETYASIDHNINWMNDRQNQFDAMVSQYSDDLQRIERAANAGLHEQQTRLMNEMNQLAGSLWANTDQLLQRVQLQYQSQIENLQNSFFSEMAAIERHLVDRNAQEDTKLAIAEQWLNAASSLFWMIDREYNHPFFLPGEMDRLARILRMAEQNLTSGLAEACVASTQQAYLGLESARARLEKEEMDWVILRQAAVEAVQAVYAELNRQREIQAIDLDGSPIDQMIDVQYWSKGEWQVLVDELAQVIQPLQATDAPPTSQYLYDLVNQYLPQFRSHVADVCFAARIEALNSQLRVNIADVVVQALSVQGFAVSDYAYQHADWRDTFETHLLGLDKSSVTVQVVPSGNELGQNELHIYSDDTGLRNQRELHQRWDEVEDLLVLSGLTVGDFEVVGRKGRASNQQNKVEKAHKRR
jgi:hypothetical protein